MSRHIRWSCILLAILFCAACNDSSSPSTATATPLFTATAAPSPTPTVVPADPFVDPAYFRARQNDYLTFATTNFDPGSVVNLMAHLERERVDSSYQLPAGAVPADAWDGVFTKMATLQDTRDFNALELVNLVLAYRNDPAVPPELWQKVDEALVGFKYWYTEPTAPGLIDNSYYWTENHQAIYHTVEYFAGQLYPDRVFGNDGRTGRQHQEHAREMLLRWLDLRARLGFSEWHSNVYYHEDMTPLLTLAEHAEDDDLRERATMVVDILLFDLSLHTFRGAFGVTHGRSYKKDKMSSLDEDTWDFVKLLFDTTDYDYQSTSDEGAVLFARAKRYRLPEAILRVARSANIFVDRERMGIPIDELGPYTANPVPPYEFSFTDPNDLVVWWGMGAITTWPVAPLTVQTMNQYDLWDTELFAPFKGLQPFTTDPVATQMLAVALARLLGFGLLEEVNTYTYRTADYMLSSALDYRQGSFGAQQHSWQATFDANAIVFTTHPFRPPIASTNWFDDTETGSYWTGEASLPRSAQHENVSIHIYAPQYAATNPPPLDFFHYEQYTHAYFPQDHFDEVTQEGAWTFGRFRDGYVALYSYRPANWVVYDPTVYATRGMIKPFDLRADGGADNVWIVECGDAQTWGSFAAFRDAIAGSSVEVTPRAPSDAGLPGGFDVAYDSPTQGQITFGWDAPLTVAGVEVPITGFPRYDNPWSQTALNTRLTKMAIDGYADQLDFDRGVRTVSAPAPQ